MIVPTDQVRTELALLGFRAIEDLDNDPIGDLDGDTALLLLALEEFEAGFDGTERGAFDETKHPRGPDGKFRKLIDRVKDALDQHIKSGGKGDPFEGFDREQLRKAAKARGIKLVRNESRESIAKKLVDDLGGGKPAKTDAPTPKPTSDVAKPAAKAPIAKPRPAPEPAKVMTADAVLAAAPKHVDGTGSRKIDRSGTAALERYRSEDFLTINGSLRGTSEEKKPAWVDGVVSRIDAVHAESKLTEDVVVHRGIGNVEAVFGPDAKRKLTGAEWQDDAFQSTTADPDVAERFLMSEQGRRTTAVIKIRVPAGTGAVQLSDSRFEAELLLERGLRMRVISDTGPWRRGQKRPRTIEVEVVPA